MFQNFLEPLRFELALSDLEDSEPEFEAELPEDLLDSHAFDTKDQVRERSMIKTHKQK
jgi:hypothetical protein